MSDRVLSTAEAKQAISRLRTIINGSLMNDIRDMSNQGQVLSDPSMWDGNLARDFRSTWSETERALRKAQTDLEELRRNIEIINRNIMEAGGNS